MMRLGQLVVAMAMAVHFYLRPSRLLASAVQFTGSSVEALGAHFTNEHEYCCC